MTPLKARELLGLSPITNGDPLSDGVIRAAFGKAVLNAHPDTVNFSDPVNRDVMMSDLKAARDLLLSEIGAKEAPACPTCRGTGVVVHGLRRYPCPKGCEA